MPAVSKVCDLPEALNWIREGRAYQWIVDVYLRKYGIRTTVSMWAVLRRKHGIERRIVRDKTLIPWEVNPEHRHGHAVSMLRAEARRREGVLLSPKVSTNLSAWLKRLDRERVVVHYDRATTEGWRYLPRRDGVDLDLIREPGVLGARRTEGSLQISTEVVIVYADGRTVPFDPVLL